VNEQNANAQTGSIREIINALDEEFARLHSRSCRLVAATSIEVFYRTPKGMAVELPVYSVGENLLRSAAAVEQTFGGITSNLWDDPFEWTLPENLSTPERVIEYLEEVEATRKRAFERFSEDSDLLKHIVVPSGETQPLINLLLLTLIRAVDFQGRAVAIQESIKAVGVPEFPC
jgi:hypothetical protein